MPYILPIRHEQKANHLVKSVRFQGPEVAADLQERMAVVLEEGEQPPDVAHFMDVLARLAKHESDLLDAADRARIREGGELSWLLQERQRADAETRAIVVDIRDRMRGLYGAKRANQMLCIKGRTPLNPDDLERIAGHRHRPAPTGVPATSVATHFGRHRHHFGRHRHCTVRYKV